MLIVDGHVHIHPCFDLSRFMDTAFANLQREALKHARGDDFTGMLLLTESAGVNWFAELTNWAGCRREIPSRTGDNWCLQQTGESVSLQIARPGQPGFFLIAGRQVVTRESLEVLAFPCNDRYRDGAGLKEIVGAVNRDRCIPVVPWGFGKWTGHRGKVLASRLENAEGPYRFFLGDNGGRIGCGSPPQHFQMARQRRIRIIPGSDPLPFAAEAGRAGSFGFWTEAVVSRDLPARDLKRLLLDPKTSIQPYGKLESPLRFIRNQVAMQVVKRRRKG